MKVKLEAIKRSKSIMKFSFLLLLALVIWIPIIVVVFTSFKDRSEIVMQNPSLLSKSINFKNYIRLFNVMDFGVYLKNSLIVAAATSSFSLIISSLAAYALVWIKFKGKNAFISFIMFVYIFPQILLAIPLFLMCYRLGLIDTKFALILTYLSFIMPFGIWMTRNYFQTIPKDLVDAGLLDGCNHMQCLFHVVIPASLPVFASVLIFSFVLAWSDYMFANILIQTNLNRTAAIGLQTLVSSHGTDFGLLCAAAVVMALPVVIFSAFIQRLFIGDLAIGSVKE